MTIYDIARQAKVSSATVSRVMNGRLGVHPATERGVRQLMDHCQFRPRHKALDSNRVLVFLPNYPRAMSHNYTSQVWAGIVDAAFAGGLTLSVRPFLPHEGSGAQLRQWVRQDGASGVIEIVMHQGYETASRLALEHLPHVVVGCTPDAAGLNQVILNDQESGQEATSYLLALGHVRVAMVSCSLQDRGQAGRYQGYQRAMDAAGLGGGASKGLAFEHATVESGVSAARQLLAGAERPTAVILTNETLALGFLQAACAMGLTIPDDLSILAYETAPGRLAHMTPPMSVMTVPSYEMGRKAVELLHSQLHAASTDRASREKGVTVQLRNSLLIRHSTTPPAVGLAAEAPVLHGSAAGRASRKTSSGLKAGIPRARADFHQARLILTEPESSVEVPGATREGAWVPQP